MRFRLASALDGDLTLAATTRLSLSQLDGQPTPLELGASPFSTISLPATDASSIVSYKYQPSYFFLTISLSIVAAIAVAGIGVSNRTTNCRT
jgi:hypothetical protein